MSEKPTHKRPKNTEVERLVAATGRTQGEIAQYLTRRLGRQFEHYMVSRMISGARTVAHDEMDALRELAIQRPQDEPVAPSLSDAPGVVPLLGFANAAGSTIHANEDNQVGVVPIHPAQHNSRGAYAFYTYGDSTSPRLSHGDIGFAIRHKPATRDGLCVVTKTDGEVLVKFYERQDARTLYLYETNPKKREITVPLANVRRIDAVVGSTFAS